MEIVSIDVSQHLLPPVQPNLRRIALAFAWISRLLHSRNQTLDVAKAISLLDSTLPTLEAAGFEKLVFEDFYDVIVSLVRQIVVPEPSGATLRPEILLEAFQDAEGNSANSTVVWKRS